MDCGNHVLSFNNQIGLFFYWWSVDLPVFYTKWKSNFMDSNGLPLSASMLPINSSESLYISNERGSIQADIRVLDNKTGTESKTAVDLEDVSDQLDWTYWEKCVRFNFFNSTSSYAEEVPTQGRNIQINATDPVLGLSSRASEQFAITFALNAEWKQPNIPLFVVAKDDVLFDAGASSREELNLRYYPEMTSIPGENICQTSNKNPCVEGKMIKWQFNYISPLYYPTSWETDWRVPIIKFIKSQNDSGEDNKCPLSSQPLDLGSDSILSYSFNTAISAIDQCDNLMLDWANWPNDDWIKPPRVFCQVEWENGNLKNVYCPE
jgi:hypothetical protein